MLRSGIHVDTPIAILTSKTHVEDRVRGFALGADDYVVKPFEARELEARIEARIKRKGKRISDFSNQFSKANFSVDLKTQKIFFDSGGVKNELSLTPVEFRLIVHFLRSEGKIFSRHELVKTIWGESTHVSTHTVDTHISSLRKKLGPSAKNLKAVLK